MILELNIAEGCASSVGKLDEGWRSYVLVLGISAETLGIAFVELRTGAKKKKAVSVCADKSEQKNPMAEKK